MLYKKDFSATLFLISAHPETAVSGFAPVLLLRITMPIYEYQALNPDRGCRQCRKAFEVFQKIHEDPLTVCPRCGVEVRKMISWCRAAVSVTPDETRRVEREIKDYEDSGMWSHAAELADKHSEKTKDKTLKTRALDDYKKAGYDADSLAKHAKTDNE